MLEKLKLLYNAINASEGLESDSSKLNLGKIYDTLLAKSNDDSGFSSFNSSRYISSMLEGRADQNLWP